MLNFLNMQVIVVCRTSLYYLSVQVLYDLTTGSCSEEGMIFYVKNKNDDAKMFVCPSVIIDDVFVLCSS